MFDLLTQISLDTAPFERGFQPSTLYIVASLLIPATIGFTTAIISRILNKPAAEK